MSVRLLALVPYQIFPAHMGGQKGIALFYQYLCKQLPLAVLTTRANNEHNAAYPVHAKISNSASRYANPALFFTLRHTAKQHQATHLLFEHPYYAWLIILCRLFTPYKLVVHAHNIEATRFKSMGKWWWPMLWLYEALAFRTAHQVWFKTQTDADYAITHYGLPKQHTHLIPYGIETAQMPNEQECISARKELQTLYDFKANDTILFFNGTLNYGPNLDALNFILHHILPRLQAASFSYQFMVCGKHLPPHMNNLNEYTHLNVHYAGFVPDIDLYFKACDVFLNPLIDGGGIKTKLVEALGFGKCAVSTANGAIGVDPAVTGGRLRIVPDHQWDAFANEIIDLANKKPANNNADFYQTFFWGYIAEQAKTFLSI